MIVAAALSEAVLRIGMDGWREFHNGRFLTVIHVPGRGSLRIGRPGFDGYFSQSNGDFRIHLRVNDFGIRGRDPVGSAQGQIWTLGDSMTFGFGVEENQTYAEKLEAMIRTGVYNFAVPGNDVCGYQIVAERIPAELEPSAVIVGLFLENDARLYDCQARFAAEGGAPPPGPNGGTPLRDLTALKVFLREHSALYNFITVALKRIDVVNEALMAIGLAADQDAEKARPAEPVPDLATRTANEIARLRALYPEDTPFAVLMIPARHEVRDGDAYFKGLRIAVTSAITARGIDVVDPVDALIAEGYKTVHFAHDGHWTPRGHELAAAAIARWLHRHRIGQGTDHGTRTGGEK